MTVGLTKVFRMLKSIFPNVFCVFLAQKKKHEKFFVVCCFAPSSFVYTDIDIWVGSYNGFTEKRKEGKQKRTQMKTTK